MTDFLGGTADVNPIREPVIIGHEACSPPYAPEAPSIDKEGVVSPS